MTVLSRDELKVLAAQRLETAARELVERIQRIYVHHLFAKPTNAPVGWMELYGDFQDSTVAEALRILQERIPEAQIKQARWSFRCLFLSCPDLYVRLD